ncbi:CCR4-NOT transcription complex subunit 6-like [Astathelohania contejeani]|uniref:CCR4-NOT transcription complex subunit 6-like n=1 Tax=Astathelohania contejeani TaxID=164912 RepID=A0ABQ7HZ82_9MICR|nr:CCR4-NOT transcription complex subunit 6-like [Thelohania contejeani]
MNHWSKKKTFKKSCSLPIFFEHGYQTYPIRHIQNTISLVQSGRLFSLNWDALDLDIIPNEIKQLVTNNQKELTLSLGYNHISDINVLMELKQITRLILKFNPIVSIPQTIVKLTNLAILDLSSCLLRSLPAEIINMKIEDVLISNNPLLTEEEVKALNDKISFESLNNDIQKNICRNVLMCSVCENETCNYQSFYKIKRCYGMNIPFEYIICSYNCFKKIHS